TGLGSVKQHSECSWLRDPLVKPDDHADGSSVRRALQRRKHRVDTCGCRECHLDPYVALCGKVVSQRRTQRVGPGIVDQVQMVLRRHGWEFRAVYPTHYVLKLAIAQGRILCCAQARSMPEGRAERAVEAQRRALTSPSTAAC